MQVSTDRPFRRPSSYVGEVWRLAAVLLAALLMVAVAQPTAASAMAASAMPDKQASPSYTAFTVSISGPATLAEWDSATYTAVPSYGTAPYTYTWFRNGAQVGTGATYSVQSVRSSFTLQVNATDALGHTASATLKVSVWQECMHC